MASTMSFLYAKTTDPSASAIIAVQHCPTRTSSHGLIHGAGRASDQRRSHWTAAHFYASAISTEVLLFRHCLEPAGRSDKHIAGEYQSN